MTHISHYIVSVLMHTAMAAMLWLPATAAGQTAADVCVEPLAADSVAAPVSWPICSRQWPAHRARPIT